ncbi:unnamed protein product [Allacma fusca]|uniref:Centromere protein J C-terminal domain-containing protein n=1 Tax=Allacma fusca TaxID=39272 RepID=A0A8J2K688_9HEXA|nr:unnamed protein product [Allacma fusca]
MSSPAETKRKQKPKHMDRTYNSHAHDLTAKDSQPDTTQLLKKPYLKKRSGLFRFYKCLPSLLVHQEKSLGSHSPTSRSGPKLNLHSHSFPLKSANSNPISSTINHSSKYSKNGTNHQHIMLGYRSTTYNASVPEMPARRNVANYTPSDQSLKEESSGVEIYEILETNNGTEKYRDASAISSRFSLHIDSNFEQGDVHHLPNFQSSPDIRETDSGSGEFLGISSSTKQLEIERLKTLKAKVEKHDAPRSFTSPRDPSSSMITNKMMNQPIVLTPTEFNPHDNLVQISSLRCGSGDEDDEEHIIYQSHMSLAVDIEETDPENLSQTSEEHFRVKNTPSNLQSFILTSQIAELHGELITMKNKVALLEKNAKEEGISNSSSSPSGHPTKAEPVNAIPHDEIPIRTIKQGTEKSWSNYQATIGSIQNGLERMDAELGDIQTGFIQKMESLEEEIHIKSQRWCENQIKMADKVHSLFSELEILSNSMKAQQHQVQNLAENVEKEFEAMRSDWKDTQAELEKKIQNLEEQNSALVNKLDANCSTKSLQDTDGSSITSGKDQMKQKSNEKEPRSRDNNRCMTTAVKRTILGSDTDVSQPFQQVKVGVSQPGPNSGKKFEGNQTSPSASVKSSACEESVSQEDSVLKPEAGTKIESIGGQIISARKTLPTGDIETVYTNGTRELIKADKSEVRHMYRNGDVRTVAPDGTVTYFYAESSTWQTTYPTGVELFKFPNGVLERRLPNGLIEQTDIDGRVTFFQATPPKPAASLIPTIPPIPVLKSDPIRAIMLEPAQTSSVGIGQGRILPHTHSPGMKLGPGERVIVFENGEEEIHGPDYRKRIFADGTVKTVYQDGSQETRYPNGRIRIKDGDGNLVADVTVPDSKNTKNNKFHRDCETHTSQNQNHPNQ